MGRPTANSEEVRRLLLARRLRAVIAGNTLATVSALEAIARSAKSGKAEAIEH